MHKHACNINGNNHVKRWRSQVSRIENAYVPERTFLLKNFAAPIIIIRDSIANGLTRYEHVWRKYFKDALDFGISCNSIENTLWNSI